MKKAFVVPANEGPRPLATSPHCECRSNCRSALRICNSPLPNDGAWRPDQLSSEGGRHEKAAIASIALLAAHVVSSAANAASYDYTAHYTHIGKPALTNAQIDAQLQADTVTCDDAVGVQRATPSASYRSCMLTHGWKYNFVTWMKVQAAPAQADPCFSSNAKVAPGHFIDHDNGMDMGGAEVCDPRTERCIIVIRIRTCRAPAPARCPSVRTSEHEDRIARRAPLDHSKPVRCASPLRLASRGLNPASRGLNKGSLVRRRARHDRR